MPKFHIRIRKNKCLLPGEGNSEIHKKHSAS